jgi:hypothetical protein
LRLCSGNREFIASACGGYAHPFALASGGFGADRRAEQWVLHRTGDMQHQFQRAV